jgi:hypothetical protein
MRTDRIGVLGWLGVGALALFRQILMLDMSPVTAGTCGGDHLAKFLAGKAAKPFDPKELQEMIIPCHSGNAHSTTVHHHQSTNLT